MVIRDLSPDEMTDCKRKAAFLRRFRAYAPFADSILMLARSGVVTRGQYEKIKELAANKPQPDQQPRKSLRGRYSKKPVTLAQTSGPHGSR